MIATGVVIRGAAGQYEQGQAGDHNLPSMAAPRSRLLMRGRVAGRLGKRKPVQHNTFLWWLMAGTLAGAAGLTASWCAVAASHYARLLATGACPDGQTLWQALAGASREIRGCIIRFQWQRGARVLTSPVFWLGVGIGLGLGLHPGPFVQRAGMALCCWLLLLLGNIDG